MGYYKRDSIGLLPIIVVVTIVFVALGALLWFVASQQPTDEFVSTIEQFPPMAPGAAVYTA